jgi:hypothetical protein
LLKDPETLGNVYSEAVRAFRNDTPASICKLPVLGMVLLIVVVAMVVWQLQHADMHHH